MSKIKHVLAFVIFILCLLLVIFGQKHVGYPGLLAEVAGLIGLLTLLFLYNKRHK